MDVPNKAVELPSSLKRIGIECAAQALLVAPQAYRDCTLPITVLPVPDTGLEVFICLRVESVTFETNAGNAVSRDDRRIGRVRATVIDELGGECSLIAFEKLDLWRLVLAGDLIYLYGQFATNGRYRSFYNPVLVDAADSGSVLPVYKGKPGLASADSIEEGVRLARPHLAEAAAHLREKTGLSDQSIKDACGLSSQQLLSDLHWPATMQHATVALSAARKVSIRAVQEQVRRQQMRPVVPSSALEIDKERAIDMARELIGRLPFDATIDQRRAIWEILQDLLSPTPMRRMLSGDVGTGKTVAFFIPAVVAHKVGWPVAIIAPNRLLVQQIAKDLHTCFPEIAVVQVLSGVKPSNPALDDPAIYIGTTALVFAAQAAGRTFKFLISDEQQKFSIDQRMALVGEDGNVLESTATAIPRTVALVSMGGLDVSVLKTCPVKKEIQTRIGRKENVRTLFSFMKQLISKGSQIAVIYPLVEGAVVAKGQKKGTAPGKGKAKGGAVDPGRSVEAAMMRFAKHFGARVGVIHGKLKTGEKTKVMEQMEAHELDVLISSTVIEIGLTMPSLRMVVVIHPERFGASQLHQLRGRVARKGGKGYFVMLDMDDALQPTSDAYKRLNLLVECSDGFELALKDAEMRGAGEIFNDYGQQSGATRGIFFGIQLTYNEIERAALDAAYRGGNDTLPIGLRSEQ